MSQGFKFRSDEFEENNLEKDVRKTDNPHYRVYPDNGHMRNFALTLPDGTSTAYPYAFLVKLEYISESGNIVITMTSDKILLQGIRLKALFNDLFYQLPLEIIATDKRYNAASNEARFIVNEIKLQP